MDTGLPSGHSTWQRVTDPEVVRSSARYRALTRRRDALFLSLDPSATLSLHPPMGGLDPAFAWKSLELFERSVRPRLIGEGRLAGAPADVI